MTVQTPQTLNQRLPSLLQSIHGYRLLACTSVQIFRPLAVRCNESTAHTIPALAHDHTPAETNISRPMRDPTAVRVTRTIGREIASRAGPPGQTRRVKAKTGGRGSVRPERGRGSGWLPQLPCLLSPSLVLLLFRPRSLSLFPFCICCCCGSRFSLSLLQIITLAHTGPPLSLLASTQTNFFFFSSLFLALHGLCCLR
jgi:hypothetical protein